jgi:CSLREA domain-containing protein
MSHAIGSRFLPILALSLLVLEACGEEKSPTGPSASSTQSDVSATAGQVVVNSLADPGNGICDAAECTLREAIKDPVTSTITFGPGLTGPVTLASPTQGGGTLVINKALTIIGPATGMVIRRRATDPRFRILRIEKAGVVTLRNLTLRGGETDLPGGGIMNFGSLALDNCQVKGNASTAHGGGIDNHGPLTLTNSKVTANTATSKSYAGIDNHSDSRLTIANSSVSYNNGIGLHNDGSGLTITNSVIGYNLGPTGGAGMSQYRGTARLDRVKVVGNGAWGGILLSNTEMTILNSTVARNGGSGISNLNGSELTILSSTIANNAGIGIESESGTRNSVSLRLTNSTVSGNTGLGILSHEERESSSNTYIVNSTVAYNGAGIHIGGESLLDLRNGIVARNSALTEPDLTTSGSGGGPAIRVSYTLIGNGAGTGVTNTDGNLVGNVSPYSAAIDPLLGILVNNGGPTATHALLTGSPAIDAASSDGCPATDQRGIARPRGPACDMGSFER